ncbi:MAG: hypothetical protein KC457_09015 [Myxococcales bacterium]|nr:hypothetical protein [Myxococcales bacterium]
MSTARPTDNDADRERDRWTRSRIRTAFVAVVEAFDDATNLAVIRHKRRAVLTPAGRVVDPPKRITEVPVAWPRFGGMEIRGELVAGDVVLIVVSDRELAPQLAQAGQLIDGAELRMHDDNDAIALPIGFSLGDKPMPAAGGVVRIGREDGLATLLLSRDPQGQAPAVRLVTDGAEVLLDGGQIKVQASAVRLGQDLPAIAKAVARDGDSVTRSAAFEVWQQAVSAAAFVAPLPPGPLGDVVATSTDVEAT